MDIHYKQNQQMRTAHRWLRAAGIVLTSCALLALLYQPTRAAAAGGPGGGPGKILVADRASGTVSVIATSSDMVTDTLTLPTADHPAEPMYVWYSPIGDRVFVGDRANDRVVAFRAGDLSPAGQAPCGAGVFHMWGSLPAKQLWVNNDIDNTSTIIDLRTLEVLGEAVTPADLVAAGGKPHDVILEPRGRYAYVTVLGVKGMNDYVVQYSTETFEEVGRAAVGKDPHVSVTPRNNNLYVPCQDTNDVYVLDRETLATVTVLDVPGAHGAGMPRNGRYFHVTNISGGGNEALWRIDTHTNTVVGMPTDSPYPVPHNIALTPGGNKLYVTHSGGVSDKVSIYSVSPRTGSPTLIGEATTGFNPFGLAYVP